MILHRLKSAPPKMLIREYRDSDLAALRAIHASQGFDYALPGLRNPLFITKLVLTGDSEDLNVAPGFSPASSANVSASPLPAEPYVPRDADLKPGTAQDATCGLEESREGNCDAEKSASQTRILGAVLLRLTAEAYLLLDPRAGTPRDRWQWLLALHEAARRDAWLRGLEDVHAWLPPPIAQKFGRRLTQLGWLRDDAWTPFCKRL